MNGSDLSQAMIEAWKPSQERSGRLILQYWSSVWHYGVALSDSQAISWGPERRGVAGLGHLTIHELESSFREAEKVSYLSQEEILKNLLASVPAFHRAWRYGVQGWNCEHWARLVVSGEPVSHQIAQTGWGVLDVFGALRRHRSAKQHLAEHVGALSGLNEPRRP